MPVDERILWKNGPPAPPKRRVKNRMNPWVAGIGGTVLEVLFFIATLRSPGTIGLFILVSVGGAVAFWAVMVHQGWERDGVVGAYLEYDYPLAKVLEGEPRPTAMRSVAVWLILLAVALSVVLGVLRLGAAGSQLGGAMPNASSPLRSRP